MITAPPSVVRMSVSVASPVAAMIAVYLLLAGHNRPGGGFAAGLLAGAIVVVRSAAGMKRPTRAAPFLGVGGLIVGLTAIAPLFWGDVLLDQAILERDVPVLGTLKTGTALVFDIGVVAIVIGLVVALLDGFRDQLSPPVEHDSEYDDDQRIAQDGGRA